MYQLNELSLNAEVIYHLQFTRTCVLHFHIFKKKNSICTYRISKESVADLEGGVRGVPPPPPPKIRKAYVIQR